MVDINEAKQNTIDSARKKASQKSKRATPQIADKQLTSYEDLVSDYETSIITTTSGKVFVNNPWRLLPDYWRAVNEHSY